MEKESPSASVRNYAIAGACLVFVMLIAGVVLNGLFGSKEPSVWSQCEGEQANVFVGANDNLGDVRCVALDKEFFVNPEITIGDLPNNNEGVCRFKLSKNTTEPLRFEVWYRNNDFLASLLDFDRLLNIKREVCNWSNFVVGAGVD